MRGMPLFYFNFFHFGWKFDLCSCCDVYCRYGCINISRNLSQNVVLRLDPFLDCKGGLLKIKEEVVNNGLFMSGGHPLKVGQLKKFLFYFIIY